jgi:hypothetical protein
MDGVFGLGRLHSLSPDQIQFVELFIKVRGKIKDLEEELRSLGQPGSYPTVVARLNEVVRAMGYEVDERDLSEVEQYEMYEAQVIQPRGPGQPAVPLPPGVPGVPMPPRVPAPPAPVAPPKAPTPTPPRMSAEKREKILDDLRQGKITIEEAMSKLHGEG